MSVRYYLRRAGALFLLVAFGFSALAASAQEQKMQNQYLPLSNYLPLFDLAPPRFQRIEQDDGKQVISDYFDQIMDSTNHRVFRFAHMPVSLYIQPINQPGYMQACLLACENWQGRTNGQVRFAPTADAARARIRVVWKHLGVQTDATEFGAHTITEWHNDPSPALSLFSKTGMVAPQTIEVNLDIVDARDADLRLLLLQNIVTHELGHALGLIGHSLDRGDMMYKDTDEFSRISQRDLNTLRRLYGQRVDFPL